MFFLTQCRPQQQTTQRLPPPHAPTKPTPTPPQQSHTLNKTNTHTLTLMRGSSTAADMATVARRPDGVTAAVAVGACVCGWVNEIDQVVIRDYQAAPPCFGGCGTGGGGASPSIGRSATRQRRPPLTPTTHPPVNQSIDPSAYQPHPKHDRALSPITFIGARNACAAPASSRRASGRVATILALLGSVCVCGRRVCGGGLWI